MKQVELNVFKAITFHRGFLLPHHRKKRGRQQKKIVKRKRAKQKRQKFRIELGSFATYINSTPNRGLCVLSEMIEKNAL